MKLPKYDVSSKKGEDGTTIVKAIVEDKLKWIFRKNNLENDFGIDAYIDLITDKSHVTGKSIALQIKTGDSYFKEQNDIGWIFHGELKHLNYYLNHDIPVVIVLVDDQKKSAYWCLCDPSKTEKAGENWKITVPFNQKLEASSKSELSKYVSPITDYVSQLEYFWEVNKHLKETDRIIFIVDKSDIEKKNYSQLIMAFARLEVNAELILNLKGKVDVWIHGYDEDKRELYEIKEVKEWLIDVFKKINSWTYFLAMDKTAFFLKSLFICHAKVTRITHGKICTIKYEKSENFILEMLNGLNEFCDKHNISEATNKELTYKLFKYLSEGKIDLSKAEVE